MTTKTPRRIRFGLPGWRISISLGGCYSWGRYPSKSMVGRHAGVICFGFGIMTYMQVPR
ncbi:MAG TPA: hypothetical protein VNM48_01375 [Chloroflexota bacterium]|nr:hypothetical protein [Chloroflexota bacterium]